MNTYTRTQQWFTRIIRVSMLLCLLAIALTVPAHAAAPPTNGGTTLNPPGRVNPGPPPGGGVMPTPVVVNPNPGILFFSCDTYQCIKYLQYEAHGTFALFNFITTQTAVATVQISAAAPVKQADGTWVFPGGAPYNVLSAKQGQHAVEVDNLSPGTAYHFLITAAKGSMGDDAQSVGTFTTLKRMVTVNIGTIKVIDDSDFFSAGDLAFNLRANGSAPGIFPTADMISFNPQNTDSTIQWSSGETKTVNMQVKVAVGDQATVLLEGWDWDSNQSGWLNQAPINIEQDTIGISGDRADVSQSFDVTADEKGSLTPKAFTLQTTNNSLKYSATGTITISYE